MKSPPGIWETHYQRSYVPFTPIESVNLRETAAGLSSAVSAEYRAKSEERRFRRPVARMSLEPRSRSEGPSRPIYNRTKGKRTLNTMNALYSGDTTAAGKVTRKLSSIHPSPVTHRVETGDVCVDSGKSPREEVALDTGVMSQSNSSNGSNDTTVTVTSDEIDKVSHHQTGEDVAVDAPIDDIASIQGENVSPCIDVKLRRKTEYKSKFRPFSAYVYLPGDGFKKRKNLCNGEFDRAKEWYHEVTDRSLRAFELQKASQSGHPIVGDGRLDEIYSKDVLAGPWAHAKDRSLDALSLATVQLRIQEKRKERQDEEARKAASQSLSGRTASPVASSSLRKQSALSSTRVSTNKIPPQPARRPSKSKSPGPPGTVSPLGKVWIRAQQKNDESKCNEGSSPRPVSLTASTRSSQAESLIAEAAVKAASHISTGDRTVPGPVKVTDIKTPEEATGIKSPDPESWTVELEAEKPLVWTNGTESHVKTSHTVDSAPLPVAPAAVSAVEGKKAVTKNQMHRLKGTEKKVIKHVNQQNDERADVFERADSAENSAASTTASTDSSFLNQSSSCEVSSTSKGHSKARQKASVVIEKTRKRLNNLWTKK